MAELSGIAKYNRTIDALNDEMLTLLRGGNDKAAAAINDYIKTASKLSVVRLHDILSKREG